MARSTRQKSARIEGGKAPPTLGASSDAVRRNSTNTDELQGAHSPIDKYVIDAHHLTSDGDYLWGHLGLLQPGEVKTSWYPITAGELERIWLHLQNSGDDDWLVIPTLNNRILAFRSTCMKRVWLLDDEFGWPEGDSDGKFLLGDCDGLPKEVYRAMGAWAWEQLDGPGDFSEKYSETLQQMALAGIERAGLSDKPEQVLAAIYHSSVRLRTGEQFSYEVKPDELWEAIRDVELELSRMLYLPAKEGQFESFFSSDEVVLLDMPLIEVEEAMRRERQELEEAA